MKHAKSDYYRNNVNTNLGNRPQKVRGRLLDDLMGKKSAITEISEIQGFTNAKDITDHLNKHFTQIGSDLAEKNSASSVNPEDYLR